MVSPAAPVLSRVMQVTARLSFAAGKASRSRLKGAEQVVGVQAERLAAQGLVPSIKSPGPKSSFIAGHKIKILTAHIAEQQGVRAEGLDPPGGVDPGQNKHGKKKAQGSLPPAPHSVCFARHCPTPLVSQVVSVYPHM